MYNLKDGVTTGACAAGAAKAAVLSLLHQKRYSDVKITLPSGHIGEELLLPIASWEYNTVSAIASVIKDSGDSPDVTNGLKIFAEIKLESGNDELLLTGGEGVGKVTKKGIPIPPGEYAINPIPREMILNEVRGVLISNHCRDYLCHIKIYVPDGERVAKQTLNPRLGIYGGISILGTTGIVKPFSIESFKQTIYLCINVATMSGRREIVFSTGRGSERVVEQYLRLPRESYIIMGDFAGYSLKMALAKGINKINIAGRIGKLSKIALGYFNTHCKDVGIDFNGLSIWLSSLGFSSKEVKFVRDANTMMEVSDFFLYTGRTEFFYELCKKIKYEIQRFLGTTLDLRIITISYNGDILIDV